MYFTIIPPEALGAFQRLRHEATVLSTLSASVAAEAEAVTDRYARALAGGGQGAWASFISATATLVQHTEAVDPIVHLDARERVAHDYFEQITRENADLLNAEYVSAA